MHMGGTRMKYLMGTAILSSAMLFSTVDDARADWIQDMMDPACDPGISGDIAAGIRQTIEDSVKRAEASIQAAIPTADLSCLTGLMNAPLDIFSNIGGIMGNLQSGISGMLNPGALLGAAGEAVNRQVCQFAQDKWAEVTQPLTDALGDLSIPSIADAFSSTDSSGNTYFNDPTGPTNTASVTGEVNVIPPPIVPTDDTFVDTSPPSDAVSQMQTIQQALACHAQVTATNDNGNLTYVFGISPYSSYEERLQACFDQYGITDIFEVNSFNESSQPLIQGQSIPAPVVSPNLNAPQPAQAFPAPAATSTAPSQPANQTPESSIWNLMNGGAPAPAN